LIKINEIFHSIQGESSYSGYPTVFVRTSGCHLRCTYCDTQYAYYEGRALHVDEIIEKIQTFGADYVCLTGGEPLLQKEIYTLSKQLCDLNFKVSIETSGDIDCKDLDPRVRKVIDVKTPDSGAPHAFCQTNLNFADVNSEFKFVICSESDFDWAENFCSEYRLFEKTNVLYSPSHGVIDQKWLAKKILSARSKARLQLQLHKYIWSSQERGV
jgi:7-carboxy-7-deazaguanine synthase